MKAVLAVMCCLLGVGCQPGDQGRPRPSAQQAGHNAQPRPPIKIVATDSGFNAPAVMSAGLRHIVFENHGSQVHEAMLIKLPDGMGADQYVAAVKGGSLFPEGALDYSGPGLTAPAELLEVWLTVDAGNYILICWNGNHATTSPVHRFTVLDDAVADDVPPREDVVLRLHDFRFDLEGVLKKGGQVIRVENKGSSMHEVDIYRLHPSRTVADLKLWRKREDSAQGLGSGSPADALGGLLDSHDLGRVTWLRRTFHPGRYVLHCEMPMPAAHASGEPMDITHADVGMVQAFEIQP